MCMLCNQLSVFYLLCLDQRIITFVKPHSGGVVLCLSSFPGISAILKFCHYTCTCTMYNSNWSDLSIAGLKFSNTLCEEASKLIYTQSPCFVIDAMASQLNGHHHPFVGWMLSLLGPVWWAYHQLLLLWVYMWDSPYQYVCRIDHHTTWLSHDQPFTNQWHTYASWILHKPLWIYMGDLHNTVVHDFCYV